MRDPYLYDDCPVLRNRLGIKDAALLDKAEVDLTCKAIYDISVSPIAGDYDFAHLCKLHAYIFRHIYDWAGTPRTVPMEKQEAVLGYMSIIYSHPKEIASDASTVLDKMKSVQWASLTIEEQAKELTNNLAALWKVHPFRDGNTRTTITFVGQFARSRGVLLDMSLFEQNALYVRNALVAATAVFPDGDFRKPDFLYNIIKDSL